MVGNIVRKAVERIYGRVGLQPMRTMTDRWDNIVTIQVRQEVGRHDQHVTLYMSDGSTTEMYVDRIRVVEDADFEQPLVMRIDGGLMIIEPINSMSQISAHKGEDELLIGGVYYT